MKRRSWKTRSLRPALAASAWTTFAALCAGDGAAAAPGALPVGIEAVVRAARADAARVTGLEPGAIELVSAEPVTWRDGSLGCPQPDRLYTMALVPGYRVVLRAQGRMLDYHASARGGLLLCPAERAVAPLPDDRR